jgi:hypothetical protein
MHTYTQIRTHIILARNVAQGGVGHEYAHNSR